MGSWCTVRSLQFLDFLTLTTSLFPGQSLAVQILSTVSVFLPESLGYYTLSPAVEDETPACQDTSLYLLPPYLTPRFFRAFCVLRLLITPVTLQALPGAPPPSF